ncbi:MAG: peptidoglycan DD-metalloendopeptidase family protein [Bacillus sp. (in: firmicutes)]
MFSFNKIDLRDYMKGIKLTAIAMAVAATSLTSQTLAAATDNQVKTIYHVYKDTAFIGNITEAEKEQLDSYLGKKLTLAEKDFPAYEMEVDSDILFIPEQVFEVNEENAAVLNQLKDEIQIEAKTTALVIDGEKIQLSSKEEAEQLLESFQLQYMTAEELEQYEENQDEEMQPLTDIGSRITSIDWSKEFEIAESTAVPSDILTVEEAINLLNTGVKEIKSYAVQEGDVLGSIASDHQLTTDELLALNTDLSEDTVLQIGQEINVTVQQPIVELAVTREIYERQAIAHETTVEKTDTLNKGETEVKQEGQDGETTVHYTVTQQNGKQTAEKVISKVVTKEAVTEIVLEGTKTPSVGTGSLVWPTVGGYVSSEQGQRWGKYHKGIDIARPSNLSIKAADNGVVVEAGYNNGGYGNKVVINHNNGMKTVYAHMDSISVEVGQVVEAGTTIGVMGSTGNSTGVHLHFEVYKNGSLVNPLDYL